MAHPSRFAPLLALITASLGPACSADPTVAPGSGGAGATSTSSSSTTSGAAGMGGMGETGGMGGIGGAGGAGGVGGAGGIADGGPPTIRRPFLVGRSLRVATSERRADWGRGRASTEDALDAPTAALLAKTWLQDAREEHASIAAFARFTLLMLSVGAPPELLRDAQRASLDEIEHARGCFALAKRYGAEDVGPSALDLTDSLKPMSLLEIAVLTAEEGCVGETLGAALAMVQAEQCEDPEVKRFLLRLSVDEQRHAKLAWAFVAWAIQKGGSPVRDAVVDAIKRAANETLAAPVRSYEGVDQKAWHAHGRVTCEEAREAAREAIADVLEPAMALLGA